MKQRPWQVGYERMPRNRMAEEPTTERLGYLAGYAWLLLQTSSMEARLPAVIKRHNNMYRFGLDQLDALNHLHDQLSRWPALEVWGNLTGRVCAGVFEVGQDPMVVYGGTVEEGTLLHAVCQYAIGRREYSNSLQKLVQAQAARYIPRQDLVLALDRVWLGWDQLSEDTCNAFRALCKLYKIEKAYELVARST